MIPHLFLGFAKRLRHNVKARSSLFHPSGLIPFPFGLQAGSIFCFLFSLFLLKNTHTDKRTKRRNKQK
jgi:hypothetical protein